MNKKQYNNVIENTLKHENTDDSLSTARAIFDNMGVALPQGDINTVYGTISTDNYMGWKSCTMQEAQAAADNGTAAIGISEDRIVVLSANDEEQPVTQTASVMTLNENTSAFAVEGMRYYSYSYGGTTCQGGCGDNVDIGNYNDRYTYELVQTFGFTNEVAMLIRSLYDKVDNVFCSETYLQKAWKCARLLSAFCYDGILWDNVAGLVVVSSDVQSYFVNRLGYSSSEFNNIKKAIVDQHDGTLPDFAHMQYSLSARIAYKIRENDSNANLGTVVVTSENISYLAGWLGDATLAENGTTTMKNDDYCADLDAENIYRRIIQGYSSVTAINLYYSGLSACRTRADVFLSHISYSTVKEKVFYELIERQLLSSLDAASKNNNIPLINYYLNLLNNEEYYWSTIRTNYPDTYDFLKSLNDRLSNISDYS